MIKIKADQIVLGDDDSFTLIAGSINLHIWYQGSKEDKKIGSDANRKLTIYDESRKAVCVEFYQTKKFLDSEVKGE